MFCLSGQKGRDAMKTDRRIGGRASVSGYRHPLVFRISLFLSCLADMPDPKAKRRVRWTPMAASIAAALMAMDPGCGLGVRCEDALRCMACDFTRRRRVGKTYNGLLKALERQSAVVLPAVKADLRRQAQSRCEQVGRTSGWTLLAVDGSKEDLPCTADHEREFGIADNGVDPQALMTAIVEVRTGLLWDWRIGRGRASEKNHLLEMAADLPDDVLLLADGNFVGYPIWSALHQRGRRFLIRVGGNVRLITGLWPDAVTRRRRDIVCVWPKGRQNDAEPLTLRLIRVGSGDKTVHLLTNVLESTRLSKRTAGELYRLRWGVELFYRTLKRTLDYAKLRSKAGRRARLELEWSLIATSILTMMGIDALKRRRRDPRRLSHAQLLRVLRRTLLVQSLPATRSRRTTFDRDLGSCLKDAYQRKKPKHARHRGVTKNTPSPLRLKPPQTRPATQKEQDLAKQYRQSNAA